MFTGTQKQRRPALTPTPDDRRRPLRSTSIGGAAVCAAVRSGADRQVGQQLLPERTEQGARLPGDQRDRAGAGRRGTGTEPDRGGRRAPARAPGPAAERPGPERGLVPAPAPAPGSTPGCSEPDRCPCRRSPAPTAARHRSRPCRRPAVAYCRRRRCPPERPTLPERRLRDSPGSSDRWRASCPARRGRGRARPGHRRSGRCRRRPGRGRRRSCCRPAGCPRPRCRWRRPGPARGPRSRSCRSGCRP